MRTLSASRTAWRGEPCAVRLSCARLPARRV